jgi:predicted transcriptional regulator
VAALGALIAVGLAACGGGGASSSTTSTATELTKSQLIAQGDAICSDAHDRFAQVQSSPPTTSEEAATFTQRFLDITESEVSQLRALNAPASVKPALDDYLKARDRQIAILKQGLAAAQKGDATAYSQAQAKVAKGQVDRLQLARAVGFKQCSVPAGTAPSG